MQSSNVSNTLIVAALHSLLYMKPQANGKLEILIHQSIQNQSVLTDGKETITDHYDCEANSQTKFGINPIHGQWYIYGIKKLIRYPLKTSKIARLLKSKPDNNIIIETLRKY